MWTFALRHQDVGDRLSASVGSRPAG